MTGLPGSGRDRTGVDRSLCRSWGQYT